MEKWRYSLTLSYPSALNGNKSTARLSLAVATAKDVPVINNRDNKIMEDRIYISTHS